MPKVCYVPKKFTPGHMEVIRQANAILQDYDNRGMQITLRQLYYQFVVRGWLPNEDRQYKRLGEICVAARMAGQMDWNHLIDRTRELRSLPHWTDPSSIMRSVANGYRTDRWERQDTRVQVWIEKDAAIGVIQSVCAREDVPYFSCRGYTSVSELWSAAQRIQTTLKGGQDVVILHIGDHDPSGVDMSRDIEERLRGFLSRDMGHNPRGGELEVRRIALTLEQIEQYQPPPNPAKQSDARYLRYVEQTGLDDSWELDALDPQVLEDLIREHILNIRDDERWTIATEDMEAERESLVAASDRWDEVVEFIERDPD